MNIIKQLFCKHEYKFVHNLHGDEINQHNGKRSLCKCNKCGKLKYCNRQLEPILSLDTELNNIVNEYYNQKQKDWEYNNAKLINNLISECKKAASRGEYYWTGNFIFSRDDFFHFKHFIESHHLRIVEDDIIQKFDSMHSEETYERFSITISWNS